MKEIAFIFINCYHIYNIYCLNEYFMYMYSIFFQLIVVCSVQLSLNMRGLRFTRVLSDCCVSLSYLCRCFFHQQRPRFSAKDMSRDIQAGRTQPYFRWEKKKETCVHSRPNTHLSSHIQTFIYAHTHSEEGRGVLVKCQVEGTE